jgi:hypothetical protein
MNFFYTNKIKYREEFNEFVKFQKYQNLTKLTIIPCFSQLTQDFGSLLQTIQLLKGL